MTFPLRTLSSQTLPDFAQVPVSFRRQDTGDGSRVHRQAALQAEAAGERRDGEDRARNVRGGEDSGELGVLPASADEDVREGRPCLCLWAFHNSGVQHIHTYIHIYTVSVCFRCLRPDPT